MTVRDGDAYTVKEYKVSGYDASYSDGHYAGEVITVKSDIVITITWTKGSQILFESGSGTKDDPYVVADKAQFTNIYRFSEEMATSADNYYYFSVVSDLAFTEDDPSPFIPLFRGEIDFNGHTVSGVTSELLNKMNDTQKYYMVKYPADEEAYSLISMIMGGKISNLNYVVSDATTLLTWGNWSNSGLIATSENNVIELSNVKISGTKPIKLGSGDTNYSPFISQAFNTELRFTGCVNEVSFTNGKYGAAFLGGYCRYSKVVFENCVNKGEISMDRAGVLIGNHSYSANCDFEIRNCSNEGIVKGTTEAGFFCAWKSSFVPKSLLEEGNTIGEVSTAAAITGVDVSKSAEGIITITSTNESYAKYEVLGTVYAKLYDENGDCGTQLVAFSTGKIDAGETTFSPLDVIDIKGLGEGDLVVDDAYGNKVATKDSVTYFVNDGRPVSEGGIASLGYYVGNSGNGYKAKLSYVLNCYDADGKLAGSKMLSL